MTDHLKSLFLNDMVGEGGRQAPVGDVHRKVQRDLTAPSETGTETEAETGIRLPASPSATP